MELLNNDVIFNATKTNGRIGHYAADRQRCITKISMRKLTIHSGSLQGIYYLLHSERQIIFSRGLKPRAKSKEKQHQ